MKRKLLLSLTILLGVLTLPAILNIITLPCQAETGIVYDWGSGFKIQTRPDAKLSAEDKEWIDKNFKLIEREMFRRRSVIREFYGCCNNNGGSACNKILLKY